MVLFWLKPLIGEGDWLKNYLQFIMFFKFIMGYF
jgi:hypothetical protein